MALTDLLRAGGEYYLGQENIAGAEQLGREAQAGMQALAQQVPEATQFRPYTVTSGLANVAATPEGGLGVALSPEQQAAQQQLLGQATGLFGQVGADPSTAQAELFEQMRAVQRPEEERQRLALEERMLSQGRLGLSSAAYGGASPELLAMETARQEAMARANLGARQQAMAEQSQAAQLGSTLQAAGYQPQAQALGLFGAAQIPAQLQQRGQLAGAELGSQLEQSGLEARLQAEDLANRLRLQRDQGLMTSLLGQQPTMQEQLMNRIIGGANATPLTGGSGLLGGILQSATQYLPSFLGGPAPVSSSTNQALNSLINSANTLPSVAQLTATPQAPPMLGQSGFLSSISLPTIPTYTGGSISAALTPPPIPTSGQSINLGNLQAPANFGYQMPTLPII